MYKVFLVDDEELVIKSLKASVKWDHYGFEVIGFALSGIEAYTKIQEMKPDVVFTDIRMPGSSGLELIKNIKELNMNTIFIVVSGYAEFAYAQKAMNYGALGYCLKPFDDIEIINFLKRAKSILDSTKASEYIQLMDLIEENNEKSKTTIQHILLESGIHINSVKKTNILVSLGKNKLIFKEISNYLTLKIGYDKYAYFIPEIENINVINNLIQNIEVKGIGVSKGIDDISKIKKAIQQAEIMAYSYFTTCRENDLLFEQKRIKDNENSIKKLEEALSRDDVPSSIKVLVNMADLFEQGYLNIKHAIIIYNHIMAFSSRLKNLQFEDYVYSFEKLTDLFTNAKEMLVFLKELISEELNIQYEFNSQKVMNQTFKCILRYVNENFCKDISAQSLAKDFNVNSNYFSQLFKKELGIGFAEYMSKLRMDYACKLLKTTDIPISEISEQVGYNDYFYFSRAFKKVIGKSPSFYRMDFS